ncbi:MAG TPA: hypothetical protein VKD25_08915 [Burkholderiales bacterium]|nr:hypothetical protein [Burkholderiales bacterium]
MKALCRWLAVVIVALSTAGCAEMRWSKPGADSAGVEEDLAQCRGEARLQAQRISLPRTAAVPPGLGTDSLGRAVPAPPRSRTEDPMLLEQDLTSSCMRGKGYELAPLRP